MSEARFLETRTGALTVSIDDRHLHSRFDPVREAERFVSTVEGESPRLVIVVGPGLGYAFDAIRRVAPHARTLGIPLVPGLSRRFVAHADATWQPDRESIDRFLTRELTDLDTASLNVLEWQPAIEASPEAARRARAALSRHVSEAQASLVTRGAFGRRWYRNRIHNYLNITPVAPSPATRRIAAVVIAGAGPGLERGIPTIAAARRRIELWATSSALSALAHAGLWPDLVVATDAAVYAWEHLRPLIARGAHTDVPVAAPLAATRGLSACARVAPLAEDDPEDEALLSPRRTGIPSVAPQGTVTATAAGLARQLTGAPVVVGGADFAWLEGRSHVRPHLSHTYRRGAASRLSPLTTAVYDSTRSHTDLGNGWTSDRTLATYARWFASQATQRYAPFFVLAPSPALAGMPTIAESQLARMPCAHPGVAWDSLDWPARDERRQKVRERVRDLRDIVRSAEPPGSARRFSVERPLLAHVAASLALPELLRWFRPASGSAATGSDRAWEDLRAALTAELDSMGETFG